MDSNILIAHSRSRFDHAVSKRILKEKYQNKLIFTYNEGLWEAGPMLVSTLLSCSKSESVILDLYGNPTKITTSELLNKAQEHWQMCMELWLEEYTKLINQR